jgi:hypothetical protein
MVLLVFSVFFCAYCLGNCYAKLPVVNSSSFIIPPEIVKSYSAFYVIYIRIKASIEATVFRIAHRSITIPKEGVFILIAHGSIYISGGDV